jgi:hypothetical protein
MPLETPFDLKFTSREVTAWGGLALLKRMLDGMGFQAALQSWDLPQPGSNRGYAPEQLIEQMIVSIWYGAARFAHADITRLSTLYHQVLAVGALWDDNTNNTKQRFRLAVARKRRRWFEGLWANAGEPVRLTLAPPNF